MLLRGTENCCCVSDHLRRNVGEDIAHDLSRHAESEDCGRRHHGCAGIDISNVALLILLRLLVCLRCMHHLSQKLRNVVDESKSSLPRLAIQFRSRCRRWHRALICCRASTHNDLLRYKHGGCQREENSLCIRSAGQHDCALFRAKLIWKRRLEHRLRSHGKNNHEMGEGSCCRRCCARRRAAAGR